MPARDLGATEVSPNAGLYLFADGSTKISVYDPDRQGTAVEKAVGQNLRANKLPDGNGFSIHTGESEFNVPSHEEIVRVAMERLNRFIEKAFDDPDTNWALYRPVHV